MARDMPNARKSKRFTDVFTKGTPKAATPTFESKLKEAHGEYFKKGREREAGQYSADQTGAKALAKRRAEFYIRESTKELQRRFKKRQTDKMV